MAHAWACGSVPIPSAEFQSFLEKINTPATGPYDPLEDDYDEASQRKGNAQKPSKKEKALMRARNKL